MKRAILAVALALGLTLAWLPACCVQGADGPTVTVEQEQTYEVPANKWIRQINAAAGPFEDMEGTPQKAIAEGQLRKYVAQQWPEAEVLNVVVALSPQAPSVVAQALDEILVDYPKHAVQTEGMNVLAIVMDPEAPERHAWLVLLLHLEESNATALHILEMRRVPAEEQS